MQKITLIKPDDWHLHVRDDAYLAAVIPHTASRFGRAIVMPNLKPPVTTVAAARAYRDRILAVTPAGSGFQPLMTLYLTDNTVPSEIRAAKSSGFVHAVKYYPAGATTNSDSGVTKIDRCMAVFETMAEVGMPLLVHGEVTDGDVDIFDREKVFIDTLLGPLTQRLPSLRIVFEHATTADAVAFVQSSTGPVAATITPHHLILNRNALFAGGVRPHHYCLPIVKRERHRVALVEAATSGSPKFFLGTDSAPHARHTKEAECGCAGVYAAHAGIELYAEAFEDAGVIDRLEGFASRFGPAFYGLPVNGTTITLERREWDVPTSYPYGNDELVPFRAGGKVRWQLAM